MTSISNPEAMVLSRVGNATYLLASLMTKTVETLESEAACYHDLALHNARRAVAEDTPDDERRVALAVAGEHSWKSRLIQAVANARKPVREKRVGFV